MPKTALTFTLTVVAALLLVQAVCAVETYQMVAKWGSFGTGNGELYLPKGVAVGASENVYVADTQNNRIQEFDSSGGYVTKWGTYGIGNGEFEYPYGIAVDTSGHIFVTDSGNHRIQEFDSSHGYVAQWGTYGTGDTEFISPSGVALDASGNVYVADYGNDRIQKFDKAAGASGGSSDASVQISGNTIKTLDCTTDAPSGSLNFGSMVVGMNPTGVPGYTTVKVTATGAGTVNNWHVQAQDANTGALRGFLVNSGGTAKLSTLMGFAWASQPWDDLTSPRTILSGTAPTISGTVDTYYQQLVIAGDPGGTFGMNIQFLCVIDS
jgi:streptogramin lyase